MSNVPLKTQRCISGFSDRASKLFKKMFLYLNIAKNFRCAGIKATPLVKDALASHCAKKLLASLASQLFAILMDESNEARNKSCIILITLDENICDVILSYQHVAKAECSKGELPTRKNKLTLVSSSYVEFVLWSLLKTSTKLFNAKANARIT